MAKAKLLNRGDVFADHRIDSVVGRGAMGTVYAARRVEAADSPMVALKVLLPGAFSSEEMKVRFTRESMIAASLESPYIVRTYDAGTVNEQRLPYLVMELLDGEELAAHLQHGELEATTTLRFVAQIASALDQAHAAGVVHRDLKPENVYVVAGDDGISQVKVLDFGIAKVMDTKTITQGILGTPLYISPEQVHGEARVSPRSDIYALGMLTFTMLTGQAYWSVEHDENLYAFLSAVVAGPSESPCARAAELHDVILPVAFDAWFAQATATDPSERFETASALAHALAGVLRLPWPDRL